MFRQGLAVWGVTLLLFLVAFSALLIITAPSAH